MLMYLLLEKYLFGCPIFHKHIVKCNNIIISFHVPEFVIILKNLGAQTPTVANISKNT